MRSLPCEKVRGRNSTYLVKEAYLKGLTRREFFSRFSRDTLKDIYGGWYNFSSAEKGNKDHPDKLSGDEAIFELVERIKKRPKKNSDFFNRKEGFKE
jgi:hypothetical protein